MGLKMETRQCLSLILHILTTYVEIDNEIILDKGKIANIMNEDVARGKENICFKLVQLCVCPRQCKTAVI